MKIHRFPLLLTLFVLGSLFLTGCGGTLVNDWPGLSTNQSNVFLSYQGAVYAINTSNGSVAWNFPKDPDPSKPFYAAPAISEDGMLAVGNYGHTLYGLDENGNQLWAFPIEGGNFVASPLILDDMVLAPASNDTLYALNRSGSLLWTFKAKNMLWAQPASDGETIFLPALDHNLYALNRSDGSIVWTTDMGSSLLSAPLWSEDGSTLYVSNLEGEVIAVNPENGSVNWRTPTGASIWSTPALHEGTLYTGNNGGKITAIAAEDGQVLWQKDAGSPVIGGGAVLPDAVAFPTEGGNLIAYSFDGKTQMWNQTVNGKLYTTPVVAGDTLVVAVMESDKQLQAFSLTGQPSWPFTLPK